MTSSNGNIFHVTGPLRGEFTVAVNSPHKGQWCRALMFSLICTWINSWGNNHEAGDLRCHRAHYDVTVITPLEAPSVQRSHPKLNFIKEQRIDVKLITCSHDRVSCTNEISQSSPELCANIEILSRQYHFIQFTLGWDVNCSKAFLDYHHLIWPGPF